MATIVGWHLLRAATNGCGCLKAVLILLPISSLLCEASIAVSAGPCGVLFNQGQSSPSQGQLHTLLKFMHALKQGFCRYISHRHRAHMAQSPASKARLNPSIGTPVGDHLQITPVCSRDSWSGASRNRLSADLTAPPGVLHQHAYCCEENYHCITRVHAPHHTASCFTTYKDFRDFTSMPDCKENHSNHVC